MKTIGIVSLISIMVFLVSAPVRASERTMIVTLSIFPQLYPEHHAQLLVTEMDGEKLDITWRSADASVLFESQGIGSRSVVISEGTIIAIPADGMSSADPMQINIF